MEPRVKALEDAMLDVRLTLAKIDEKLNHLAIKQELTAIEGELKGIKGELKGTLGFWQFLIVTGALVALILRWPELFRMVVP
jgi:hypothetical protein